MPPRSSYYQVQPKEFNAASTTAIVNQLLSQPSSTQIGNRFSTLLLTEIPLQATRRIIGSASFSFRIHRKVTNEHGTFEWAFWTSVYCIQGQVYRDRLQRRSTTKIIQRWLHGQCWNSNAHYQGFKRIERLHGKSETAGLVLQWNWETTGRLRETKTYLDFDTFATFIREETDLLCHLISSCYAIKEVDAAASNRQEVSDKPKDEGKGSVQWTKTTEKFRRQPQYTLFHK